MKIYKKELKIQEAPGPQNYHEYLLTRNEKRHFLAAFGFGFLAISYLFYHSPLPCLVFPLLASKGLAYYSLYLRDKRSRRLREEFRDSLYALSASIAAGRQMSEALVDAHKNMRTIYGEEGIMVRELAYMMKRIFETRETEEEVLRDFARRSMNTDITSFVDIYFTCRATGGDLVKVMSKASQMIMDKMTIEREIHMLTAQKRFEAKLLTAIPLVVLLFLQLVSPDYIGVMYADLRGNLIMTVALAGICLSYFWSMKLMTIQI